MHKTIPPLGRNTWQCGVESMCLANKCNSLVSASAFSLDLICSNKSSSLLANDDITIVTSNVTQIACIQHTQLSIAATAWHLWGNPSLQSWMQLQSLLIWLSQTLKWLQFLSWKVSRLRTNALQKSLLQLIYLMGKELCWCTFVTLTYPACLQYWLDTLTCLLKLPILGFDPYARQDAQLSLTTKNVMWCSRVKLSYMVTKTPLPIYGRCLSQLWCVPPQDPPSCHNPAPI